MRKHLYNTRIGKIPWFIKRFGASELILKPLRVAFAPVIIPWLPQKSFRFQGESYKCFYHGYNMTWAGERMVEIPIARSYLEKFQGSEILEVGNVMSHYIPVSHEILDKFEKGPGIINQDIIAFSSKRLYDLILSISTFEHIGFDDDSDAPSGKKILDAIAACRRLLRPDGTFVMTVPLGYNPDLDHIIRDSELGASAEFYMRRVRRLDWEPTIKAEALKCPYKRPFPYASAILVAEFSPMAERKPPTQ